MGSANYGDEAASGDQLVVPAGQHTPLHLIYLEKQPLFPRERFSALRDSKSSSRFPDDSQSRISLRTWFLSSRFRIFGPDHSRSDTDPWSSPDFPNSDDFRLALSRSSSFFTLIRPSCDSASVPDAFYGPYFIISRDFFAIYLVPQSCDFAIYSTFIPTLLDSNRLVYFLSIGSLCFQGR